MPVSFAEALAARYGAEDTTEYSADAFTVATVGAGRRAKQWEMVGMEQTRAKQASHSMLRVVVLTDAGVDVAETADGEIAALELRRCTELDLSGNPLPGVDAVAGIVGRIPAVRELRLNHVASLGAGGLVTDAFASLTVLALNFTGVQWDALAELRAPALQRLHLEGNGITALRPWAGSLPCLVELAVGHNPLMDWGAVLPAVEANCPALTELGLNGADLPPCPEHPVLQRLTALALGDNPRFVGSPALEALCRACPALRSWRCTHKAVFPDLAEVQARMMVVAGLPTLAALNNSAVRPKERLDAELYYVQRGAAASDEERPVVYPRYDALREQHKNVVLSDASGAATSGIAGMMIGLTLRALGRADVRRTLPSSMTVDKLRTFAGAVFPHLDVARVKLSFFSGDAGVVGPSVELTVGHQNLTFFGVSDGATILVEEE